MCLCVFEGTAALMRERPTRAIRHRPPTALNVLARVNESEAYSTHTYNVHHYYTVVPNKFQQVTNARQQAQERVHEAKRILIFPNGDISPGTTETYRAPTDPVTIFRIYENAHSQIFHTSNRDCSLSGCHHHRHRHVNIRGI